MCINTGTWDTTTEYCFCRSLILCWIFAKLKACDTLLRAFIIRCVNDEVDDMFLFFRCNALVCATFLCDSWRVPLHTSAISQRPSVSKLPYSLRFEQTRVPLRVLVTVNIFTSFLVFLSARAEVSVSVGVLCGRSVRSELFIDSFVWTSTLNQFVSWASNEAVTPCKFCRWILCS